MTEDWHEGFNDASGKLFPRHPGNQDYMRGWCYCLGMDTGYENILAFLEPESFQDGYAIAQYERHCHGQETLMKFEEFE